jgi:hypothetical protein
MVSRTHLGGASCNWIDLCPTVFRSFSICSTNEVVEVEGKGGLPCHDMCREVEFQDKEIEGFVASMIFVHPVRVLIHPLPDIDTPLAGDVIGHYNLDNLGTLKAQKKKSSPCSCN